MKPFAPVLIAGFLLAAVALGAPAAQAQGNALSLEARGGITLAEGDLGDGAQSGLALDATIGYRVVPILGVYGGFSRDGFGCKKSGAIGCDMHSQGFEIGARFEPPRLPLAPWVRGGVFYHRLERSARPEGVPVALRSALGLGYEIGGGIALPLTSRVALTPGVRYRAYGADFGDRFGTGPIQTDVRYFVADVGIRYRVRL